MSSMGGMGTFMDECVGFGAGCKAFLLQPLVPEGIVRFREGLYEVWYRLQGGPPHSLWVLCTTWLASEDEVRYRLLGGYSMRPLRYMACVADTSQKRCMIGRRSPPCFLTVAVDRDCSANACI